MNNISPIGTPNVNKDPKMSNLDVNNLTPYELRKMFSSAPTSLILTRISNIKEHIKSEIIKKKTMNKSYIDYNLINDDIDNKINSALENIKYEIFAGNISQLSETTINFLRLLFYNFC
jgi:hypothetical protein